MYIFTDIISNCISVVSLTQTAPSYTPVCLGDRLVLTCIVNDNEAYWRPDNLPLQVGLLNGTAQVLGSFSINAIINSITTVATATNESVPLSLNGATVGCRGSSGQLFSYTVKIAGKIIATSPLF